MIYLNNKLKIYLKAINILLKKTKKKRQLFQLNIANYGTKKLTFIWAGSDLPPFSTCSQLLQFHFPLFSPSMATVTKLNLKADTGEFHRREVDQSKDAAETTDCRTKKVVELGNGSQVIYISRFLNYDQSWDYLEYLNKNIPWNRPTIRVFGRSCVQVFPLFQFMHFTLFVFLHVNRLV